MVALLALHTVARVDELAPEPAARRPSPGPVLISYVPGSVGEDALVLGRVLSEAIGVRPMVHSVVERVARKHAESAEHARNQRLGEIAEAAGRSLEGLDPVCTASVARSGTAELARIALEQRPSVVVLGASSAERSSRLAPNGVATTFLHEVPCAIAVAPAGYAERIAPRLLRIAVAFDGGEEARVALESAVELAARTRARLSLLAAVNSAGGGLFGPFVAAGGGEAGVVELQRGAMERVLRLGLDRVPDDMPVDSRLLLGPAAEIAEAAGEHDLLVLGSRGHGALGRALLGSLSATLIAETSSPVLVLPRTAGDDPLGIRADSLHALV